MTRGWKTSEHLLVAILTIAALWLFARGHAAGEVLQLLSAPSVSIAAYAISRGLAKGAGSGPFVETEAAATARVLSRLFPEFGRRCVPTNPEPGRAVARREN